MLTRTEAGALVLVVLLIVLLGPRSDLLDVIGGSLLLAGLWHLRVWWRQRSH